MSEIRTIEAFYENMAIPDACALGKRLFKKQFYEHGQLNSTDKKAFVEDIEGITWSYTLKPSTINIPKLENETYEYLEIAVLQVALSNKNRYERISSVIQKAIPYPLLIVFLFNNSLAISAADKRVNRADANKILTEAIYDTGWIELFTPNSVQEDFLSDFCATNFSYRNLYDFYQDAVGRIIALNCAAYSGRYQPSSVNTASKTDRIESLQQIEKLHQERTDIRNNLSNEKNLGKQVDLNTRIKLLNDRIEAIRKDI